MKRSPVGAHDLEQGGDSPVPRTCAPGKNACNHLPPAALDLPMRRSVLTLGVFLVIGAILNIAIAWCLAITDTPQSLRTFRANLTGGRLDQLASPVITPEWIRETASRIYAVHRAENLYIAVDERRDSRGCYRSAMSPYVGTLLMDRCYGWPMISMGGGWRATADSASAMSLIMGAEPRNLIELPFLHDPSWVRECQRALPIGLLWPGFWINTMVYALAAGLLIRAPLMLRRRRRIRRRLCAACAYPIGTSPSCTECGAQLQR